MSMSSAGFPAATTKISPACPAAGPPRVRLARVVLPKLALMMFAPWAIA